MKNAHLRDGLEEEHAVGLGADVVVYRVRRGLVVSLQEPHEAVRDELKVRVPEVLHGDDAGVAEAPHALREVCGTAGGATRR